jgi:hypothetical protein
MHRYTGAAIGLGLAVAIIAGLGNGAQAANLRTGPITKFTGTDEIVFACTTATAFTNMPAMSRTFAVGGPAASSVVVTFVGAASMLFGQQFDTGFVRLRIDNTVVSPGDIPLIGVEESGTHGFTWESAPLTPGNHTARIQWRTDLGSNFCVDARSLTILHK